MGKTKRLVFLSLLVSQALVLSYVETLIPVPVPIPGVKLGLANIISLLAISLLGLKSTLAVVMVRCLLSSVYGGGPVVLAFSLAGGLLSALVMGYMIKFEGKFVGLVSISMIGAVFHNIGQLAAAVIVMKDLKVLTYLPVLLLSGIITGYFTGICSGFAVKRLKNLEYFHRQ